jgi:hypothetical protein
MRRASFGLAPRAGSPERATRLGLCRYVAMRPGRNGRAGRLVPDPATQGGRGLRPGAVAAGGTGFARRRVRPGTASRRERDLALRCGLSPEDPARARGDPGRCGRSPTGTAPVRRELWPRNRRDGSVLRGDGRPACLIPAPKPAASAGIRAAGRACELPLRHPRTKFSWPSTSATRRCRSSGGGRDREPCAVVDVV